MLDWLKTILGEAYSDEIDKKVSEEIGKGFVARADFNAVNAEKKQLTDSLKERDTQLNALKESTGDITALKEQISKLQEDNAAQAKSHAEELKKLRVDAAVESALVSSKAKNGRAVKALLNLEKAELAEDGTVKGLAEQIKALAEGADTGFLFEAEKEGAKGTFKGFKPAEGGDGAAGAAKPPKEMSYDEVCAYLAANPNAALS